MSAEVFTAPASYEELQNRYGEHVDRLLDRSNQHQVNSQDLRAYVWVKLIEAQVLDRFQRFMSMRTPPGIPTATEFRNFLNRAVLNNYANFCRTLKRQTH